jgi:hypothetical protein
VVRSSAQRVPDLCSALAEAGIGRAGEREYLGAAGGVEAVFQGDASQPDAGSRPGTVLHELRPSIRPPQKRDEITLAVLSHTAFMRAHDQVMAGRSRDDRSELFQQG